MDRPIDSGETGAASSGSEPGRRERAEEAVLWEAGSEPLVAVFRGGALEEVHRGVIAVAEARGRLLGGIGDPSAPVLMRSAAKPFQALAVVASGAADAFAVTDEELAVMCASHAGEEAHVRVVAGLLERLGLSSDDLVCGTHPPFSRTVRAELQRVGARPSILQNNCSGKHAGMLALALHLGAPVAGYEDPDHPVQREIALTVSRTLGRDPSPSPFKGIDGCGVPVLSVTALEAATLFAQLMEGSDPSLARVRDAMLNHPELVGGEGRFDTHLMSRCAGLAVSKAGAAGAQGIALGAGADRRAAVGCFIKLADGTSDAIPLAAGSFLRAWGESDLAQQVAGPEVSTVRTLTGRDVGLSEFVAREADLKRREPRRVSRDGSSPGTPEIAERRRQLRTRGVVVEAGGGRERAVVRFLRQEWPIADEQILGSSYDWRSESFDLEARAGRRVVGVLRGHVTGGVATIDELLVHHEFRRMGIGALMLGLAEEDARENGCHKVALRTPAGSEAEAFYRGRGYSREYLLPRHHYLYDFVGMAKSLS
jgi:L-asparaginase II/GNAT superfamily N-acetyltransferase